MSKTVIYAQSNGTPKLHSKSNHMLKQNYGKLTLDLNSINSNNKGSPPASLVTLDKHIYSPTGEKPSMIQGQTKSPRTKGNSMAYQFERFDLKDASKVERKMFPKTTKAAGNSFVSINLNLAKKSTNSNVHTMPFKLQEYQLKGQFSNFESSNRKKNSSVNESQGATHSTSKEASKLKYSEEPPKKYSVPTTLALTLGQHGPLILPGSSSHRTLHSAMAKPDFHNEHLGYVSFNRKNSQKTTDTEYEQPNNEKRNFVPPQTGNFFAELALKSENRSNKNQSQSHRASSPKNSANFATQYNDIVKLINEKDREIEKLLSDKKELKSTINTLNTEMKNTGGMKMILKEKEKVIATLRSTLNLAVKESDYIKNELNGEFLFRQGSDLSELHTGTQSSHRKPNKVPAVRDMDEIKSLISQLKSLTDDPNIEGLPEEVNENNFIEMLLNCKVPGAKYSRSSEATYSLSNFDNNIEIDSQRTATNQPEQEPNNPPTSLKRKDSPYYESHLKDTRGKLTLDTRLSVPENLIFEAQTTRVRSTANNVIVKKRNHVGTTRNHQAPTDLFPTSAKLPPGNQNIDSGKINLHKRNFSHDLHFVSDSTGNGSKKSSGLEGSSISSRFGNKEVVEGVQQQQQDPLNFGKALSEIKNKVARVLNQHKTGLQQLHAQHEFYRKKLESLLKEKS